MILKTLKNDGNEKKVLLTLSSSESVDFLSHEVDRTICRGWTSVEFLSWPSTRRWSPTDDVNEA